MNAQKNTVDDYNDAGYPPPPARNSGYQLVGLFFNWVYSPKIISLNFYMRLLNQIGMYKLRASDISLFSLSQLFRGNYDIYHTVSHKIIPPIKARFVRIHPRSWYSYIAMRVELYGCRRSGEFLC